MHLIDLDEGAIHWQKHGGQESFHGQQAARQLTGFATLPLLICVPRAAREIGRSYTRLQEIETERKKKRKSATTSTGTCTTQTLQYRQTKRPDRRTTASGTGQCGTPVSALDWARRPTAAGTEEAHLGDAGCRTVEGPVIYVGASSDRAPAISCRMQGAHPDQQIRLVG